MADESKLGGDVPQVVDAYVGEVLDPIDDEKDDQQPVDERLFRYQLDRRGRPMQCQTPEWAQELSRLKAIYGDANPDLFVLDSLPLMPEQKMQLVKMLLESQ